MKRLYAKLKEVSFFWRLLFTTVLSGLLSLVFLCLFLVPGLLRAAAENDRAYEERLLRQADDCFEELHTAAAECLRDVEQSEWLHELYIEHVLGEKSVHLWSQDIVVELTLAAARQGGLVEQISFWFYQEPETMFSSTGVYTNMDFYREQYPDEIQYFAPVSKPVYPHFKTEQFQGQDVLVYHTEFTDNPQGLPKGEFLIVFNQELLKEQILSATEKDVAAAQLLDRNGRVLWNGSFKGQPSEHYHTEMLSDAGTYLHQIEVTEEVHTRTSSKVQVTLIGTILLVLAVCALISLWLARGTYTPVKNLSEKYKVDKEKNRNEFSALETTIDQIFQQQSETTSALEQLRPLARQRIIDGLLSGLSRVEQTSVDQIQYCDLMFPHPLFAVVAVSGTLTPTAAEREKRQGFGWNEPLMEAMLERLLEESPASAYLHFLDDNHYRILLNADAEEDLRDCVRLLGEGHETFFHGLGVEADLIFGVGSAVQSLDDIYLSAEQAVSSLNYVMGGAEGRIAFFRDITHRINVGYYYPLSMETLFLRAITECNRKAAKSVLEDIIAANRSQHFLSYNSHRLLYVNLCATVMRSAQTLGIPLDAAPEEQYLKQAISLELIQQKVGELVDQVCDAVAENRFEKWNMAEEQILEYINQNLYSSSLSLSEIADKFQKSPAYISTVFKNRVGTNYSDYVNQARIVRATELLEQEEMTIEKACYAVGYVSLSTFRRNFSKYMKANPSDYIMEKREQ